jgi:hypothetical protein
MAPHDVHREMLAIDLDDVETLAKMRELVQVLRELRSVQDDFARSKKQWTGRIAELETKRDALSEIVETGHVEAEVEVQTCYDLDHREIYHLRCDTYEELKGRRRRMTDAEYTEAKARLAQAELPLTDKPAAGPTVETVAAPGISGPLLVSCEACGCGKGDHAEDENGEHTGKCLTCQMQGRDNPCQAYQAPFTPPNEEDLEPLDAASQADFEASGGETPAEPEIQDGIGGHCGNCEAPLPSYQADGSLCPRCESERDPESSAPAEPEPAPADDQVATGAAAIEPELTAPKRGRRGKLAIVGK